MFFIYCLAPVADERDGGGLLLLLGFNRGPRLVPGWVTVRVTVRVNALFFSCL